MNETFYVTRYIKKTTVDEQGRVHVHFGTYKTSTLTPHHQKLIDKYGGTLLRWSTAGDWVSGAGASEVLYEKIGNSQYRNWDSVVSYVRTGVLPGLQQPAQQAAPVQIKRRGRPRKQRDVKPQAQPVVVSPEKPPVEEAPLPTNPSPQSDPHQAV